MNPHQKNKPNPEDTRNMIIFFIVAAILYVGYSHFVLGPQREAAEKAAHAQKAEISRQVVTAPVHQALKVVERGEALSGAARLSFENDHIRGSISLIGGRLDDLALRDYYETLDKKKNVFLLSPPKTKQPRYVETGWAVQDKAVSAPDSETVWRVEGNETLSPDNPVTLIWNNDAGLRFERTISIDETYMFTLTQSVVNNSDRPVTLHPYGLAIQKGLPEGFSRTWISHEGPTGYVDGALHDTTYKNLRKGKFVKIQGEEGWVGFSDKYWLTAFIPEKGHQTTYNFKYAGDVKDKENKGRYQIDYVGEALSVQPGARASHTTHLFTGAKRVYVLKEYGDKLGIPHFDLAVDFGWLWFLSKPFFYALHFIGKFAGNMGVAIILLTILIRSSVFPLTHTSYKSFAKMKKVSPQISELREKYGDNKAELQKKIMELYQSEGVNPLAGCFPMILQIPIFFALYKTLFVTIEIRHAPFFGWIHDLSAPDPTSVFNLFGLIPWDPPSVLMIGVWPCLMLFFMIIQKKLNPPPQDPIQRDLANYFPFIMAFILSKFAAGLVVYWTFSAMIGVLQQMIIMRSMNVPIYLLGEEPDEEKLEKQVEKGPAVHPLIEMAEHEAEEALFGDHEDGLKDGEEKPKISPPKPKKKTPKKKKKKK